ncbi:CocE/NonD family hydrolase [Streptomyces sp. NBC_00299]|uniref:CocE/NonD family hydrolase n=1 Tax=Streptomyces sp. NBC_00299 TaxID=2975705 RepID=UPI002E2C4D81|nr:CocE/NonD family hydrolase [Streptomyces sp. NBC_00299]
MTARTEDVAPGPDAAHASVVTLLLRLRASNVRVWTSGGRLHHEAPPEGLDEKLRGLLEEHAEDLAAYLQAADGVESSTHYVTMRDGVRIAVDVFRPKRDGRVVEEPLPALWCHDRYHRSEVVDGVTWTKLDSRPWLRRILDDGYVIAAADARGTGASSGVRGMEFGPEESQDAHEITEWLAARDWCSGKVGMYGESYLAMTQFLAAGTAPPSLKAIFPQVALFDLYSFLRPGGAFRHDFIRNWGAMVRRLDTETGAAPVREDAAAVRAAAEEHRANTDVFARAAALPCRDSRGEGDDEQPYARQSPSTHVEAIAAAGVPVYQLSGWHDMWVRDAFLWHANLTGPRKLLVGDWSHNGRDGVDLAAEHLRWFDHWLKGVDTGVMDEPPIRYQRRNAPPGEEWRDTDQWPPAGVRTTRMYFGPGPAVPVSSVNDGTLTDRAPSRLGGFDDLVVDYTATSGTATRWTDGYGGPFGYEPMTGNDRTALTYTTAPLEQELEVTGHPVAELWVTSTHLDGDFFLYLEDVDGEGVSHYVTEGVIRASHRALGTAPYDNLSLPYHPCAERTRATLPEEPVPLVFDLHPVSHVFAPGHRLRIAVTCCDRDNAETRVHHPPPVVQIHRRGAHASFVDLPVLPDLSAAQEQET